MLLVGGAEKMERHICLQGEGGRPRLPPEHHFGAFWVVSWCNRQAGAHQGLLGQGQVRDTGWAGEARGQEEFPIKTA